MIKLLSLVVRLLTGLQKKHDSGETPTPLRVDLHSEIRLPAPIVDYYKAEQDDRDRKRVWDKYKVGFEIAGLVAALGLFSLTFFTLREMNKQTGAMIDAADAARKSADIARDTLLVSQRPRVSIHPKIGSDLNFSKEGGRVTIIFHMKNVGQSPAVGTSVEAAIVLLSPKRDVFEEQRKVCPVSPTVLPPGEPVSGDTVFPNEEYTVSISLPISRADIERSRAEMAEAHKDIRPDNFVSPVLVGCVKYSFAFEGPRHRTGFILHLNKIDPKHPNLSFAIDTTGGDVLVRLLRLETELVSSLTD
jgi:hypothetical protein